ncbi:MAG TPA: enoyl-CoA hydratase/isomerase family protein [Homoserinimonas sp.]|nr:enoyl-CoA hydratase/isomerase family protein [Homoserinimonas sp.]
MTARNPTLADGGLQASSALSLEVAGSVASITLGSGERRNVLAPSDWDELTRLAEQLATRVDLSVVVFRGGGRTFSAGSDLRFWQNEHGRTVDDDFARMETALQAIEQIPVPTIAVVEGVAAGAGCELALACDLRIFAQTARIGLPILQLGVLVSPHFALRMTSLIGVSRTRELLYSGRLISAAEADRLGMANTVVPQSSIESELASWVGKISLQPRSGLVAAKTASTVALAQLRSQHDTPGWTFFDPQQLSDRIGAFFQR